MPLPTAYIFCYSDVFFHDYRGQLFQAIQAESKLDTSHSLALIQQRIRNIMSVTHFMLLVEDRALMGLEDKARKILRACLRICRTRTLYSTAVRRSLFNSI